MADPTARVTVRILIDDLDISADVVFAETNFTIVAAAQPGTCQIVVDDSDSVYDFTEGSQIHLWIDDGIQDRRYWRGYLFTIERGYTFAAAGPRRWVLGGVDLNILLDKLVLYNRSDPTKYPDGGGAFHRRRVVVDGQTAGWQVTVPQNTYDREYLKAMLDDFDADLVTPRIRYKGADSKIDQVGLINPDGPFTPPGAGVTLRGLFEDLARNVARSAPDSVIFYLDPDAYVVWKAQDEDPAPFWVGDEDPSHVIGGVTGENVRDLRITSDISRIKNDTLIFAGELDPRPGSRQTYLKYRHKISQSSVDTYGRFQYSEVVTGSWTQAVVNARADKIINQEGTPAGRVEFTTFRSGLYPGQIIWVSSEAHGFLENYPIRAVSLAFPLQDMVQYQVSCSFDTQDPWGLLLALKRPPSRGIVQPHFAVIDLRRNPDQTLQPAERYTLVKEYPHSMPGAKYQTAFGYIRDSLTVYVGRQRRVSLRDPSTDSVGFLQTSPHEGLFRLAEAPSGDQRVYVEYHVGNNL